LNAEVTAGLCLLSLSYEGYYPETVKIYENPFMKALKLKTADAVFIMSWQN
jgi:hypothetical protein